MGAADLLTEVASLETFAKKNLSDPETQLAIGDALKVKDRGTYNPVTNTPALVDGVGIEGHYYQISAAGTRDFGHGNITFTQYDYVTYENGLWSRVSALAQEFMNAWHFDLDVLMPAFSHNQWNTYTYAAILGSGYNSSGATNGSWLKWKLDIPAGNWDLDLVVNKLPSSGILVCYVDATISLNSFDCYAAASTTNQYGTINLGNIARGTHEVMLLVADKNPSATNYTCRVQKARLRRNS